MYTKVKLLKLLKVKQIITWVSHVWFKLCTWYWDHQL